MANNAPTEARITEEEAKEIAKEEGKDDLEGQDLKDYMD